MITGAVVFKNELYVALTLRITLIHFQLQIPSRQPGRLFEPGVLGQAAHDVHVTDGLAGCAPGEIVNNGDYYQPPSPLIDPPAEVAVIAASYLKRHGQFASL